MSDFQTISEAIGHDHNNIDTFAEKIKSASTLREKIEWRNQFTWTLARHAISEELIMYPAMEKHMGQEGVELTNVDRAQHQAVNTESYFAHSPLTATRSKKTFTNFKACPPPTANSYPSSINY